jgi:hypothetical protein
LSVFGKHMSHRRNERRNFSESCFITLLSWTQAVVFSWVTMTAVRNHQEAAEYAASSPNVIRINAVVYSRRGGIVAPSLCGHFRVGAYLALHRRPPVFGLSI